MLATHVQLSHRLLVAWLDAVALVASDVHETGNSKGRIRLAVVIAVQ